MADDKYTKRVLYKPSPESKKMAEDYVAPVVETGMLMAFPIGGAIGLAGRGISATGRGLSKARSLVRGERATATAAKDLKAGDMRSSFLKKAEAGPPPRPAKDVQPGDARADFLYKAKRGEIKARDDRAVAAVRKPRPGEKKFIGPTKPASRPARDIQPTDARADFLYKAKRGQIKAEKVRVPREGEKKFIGPSRPPVAGEKKFIGPTRPPRAGEKDFIGPVKSAGSRGLTTKQKVVLGAGAAGLAGAGAMGYRSADKPNAAERKTFGAARPERPGSYPKANRQAAGTVTAPYEPKRKAAGTHTKSYDAKPAQNKSFTVPGIKAGRADAGRSGKMTSFQRMKARQFENEGVAGRSMTRSAAQKKAMEKVGGPSLSSLFGLKSKTSSSNAAKKTDKEVPKKSAGKSKSELAAWYRSKRQGLAK